MPLMFFIVRDGYHTVMNELRIRLSYEILHILVTGTDFFNIHCIK